MPTGYPQLAVFRFREWILTLISWSCLPPIKRCFLLWFALLAVAPWIKSQEIHEAARSGDLPAVRELLQADPDLISSTTAHGSTPLHFAVTCEDTAVAVFLLSEGADADARNGSGYTALHYASSHDKPDMVRLLVAHNADLEAHSLEGETPLHMAAAAGATGSGRMLLQLGANPEARETRHRTPLLVNARESGVASFGRLLLEYQADLNATDKYGATALELAAWRGYGPFVEFLLDAGAQIPAAEGSRQKLLNYAMKNQMDSLFFALIGEGLDLDACANASPDLINLAAASGSLAMTRLLLDHGFSVQYTDANGWTPLHCAAEYDRSGLVAFLAGEGAVLDARTRAGESAYNIACSSLSTVTAALLDSLGCETFNATFPYLEGPYLGQPLPGTIPEVFAPGIVSAHYKLHSSISFSPDGCLAAWSVMVPPRGPGYGTCRILYSSYRNGRWHYPLALSADPCDVPFFAAGGNRMYYVSRQPAYPEGPAKENIWFREYADGSWSAPTPVARVVNDLPIHWQFSVDREGTIFFGTGDGRIMVSPVENGIRQDPAGFGQFGGNPVEGVQSPFISPGGDLLLFSMNGDLYATFKIDKGNWSVAVALDDAINTPSHEICPVLSPDGTLLFFIRDWKVYWVSVAAQLAARREQKPGGMMTAD